MKGSLSSVAVIAVLTTGAWQVAAQTPLLAVLQEKPTETGAEPSDRRRNLSTSQVKLTWQLIERLSKRGKADPMISPSSLASAFVIVGQGADAAMKAAIVRVLGFGAADPAKSLVTLVEARSASASDSGGIFQSANRIVLAPHSAPTPDLLARLEQLGVAYSAEDLADPEVVAKIDAWVKEVTQGAIPEILGAPLAEASFVALDALHFKGRWKTPFDPKLTAPAPFTSTDGKAKDVAMMHLVEGELAFRASKSFVGVDLPFSNERFSLVVVTRTDKPASVKDFEKASDWLSGAGFEPRKGDLALPRFKLSDREELLSVLDSLGLDKGQASPTALAGFGKGTVLSQVVQRAVIEVDEEGAEAAAATGVMATRALAQDDTLHMVVDKPFIFALRDHATGLILVAGYVGHAPLPQAAR